MGFFMDKTWILVANASVATVYSVSTPESSKKKASLAVVAEYSHPDSRKKDHDLMTDKLGRYQSHRGEETSGRGSFAEATDPHKHEADIFAKELCQHLVAGRDQNQYKKLILVAAPHFMGLLRQCIDNHPLRNIEIKEIQKDYTQEKPDQLLSLL